MLEGEGRGEKGSVSPMVVCGGDVKKVELSMQASPADPRCQHESARKKK